eukprot:6210471-Pleurochrysis_carterae.AAC.1
MIIQHSESDEKLVSPVLLSARIYEIVNVQSFHGYPVQVKTNACVEIHHEATTADYDLWSYH